MSSPVRSEALRVIVDSQPDHPAEQTLGGAAPVRISKRTGLPVQPRRRREPPKSIELALIRTVRDTRPPKSRQSCIDGSEQTGSLEERLSGKRVCGSFGCRSHMYYRSGESRSGRRGHGDLPDDMIEFQPGHSCVLDAVLANPSGMSCTEISPLVGVTSKRAVELIARRALLKLRAQGIDVAEYLAALESKS